MNQTVCGCQVRARQAKLPEAKSAKVKQQMPLPNSARTPLDTASNDAVRKRKGGEEKNSSKQ